MVEPQQAPQQPPRSRRSLTWLFPDHAQGPLVLPDYPMCLTYLLIEVKKMTACMVLR
jgi:hypothetical protein